MMTYSSEELSDLLNTVGWSRRQLAERIGTRESTIRESTKPVPVEIVILLRTLAAVIEANPLPAWVDGRKAA